MHSRPSRKLILRNAKPSRIMRYLVLGCLTVGCSQPETRPEPTLAPTPNPIAPANTAPAAEATPPRALDLSREHLDELINSQDDTDLKSAENLMPDMFAEQKAKQKVKLDGSIITNKEAVTLQDKVDGVEVTVEFATP